MNGLLVTVDALGVDHMGAFGYERDTTPRLSAWFGKGAVFPNMVSQSSHTRESFPAILSGEYPFARKNSYSVAERTLVQEYFRDDEFSAGGFHSNPFLSRAYGYGPGYDTFYDGFRSNRSQLGIFIERAVNYLKSDPYTRAETLNEKAIDWMTAQDDDFFCWVHYMDPHGPYQPPKDLQREVAGTTYGKRFLRKIWRRAANEPASVTESERQVLIDMHDADIRYLDEHVGALFDGLTEEGLLDETRIGFTADHGQTFGEEGKYTQPRYLFESLINVPGAFWGPDIPSGRFEQQVRTMDVVPTLLCAFDYEPASSVAGEPLQPILNGESEKGRVAISEARSTEDEEMRFSIKDADRRYKLRATVTEEGIGNQQVVPLDNADGDVDAARNRLESRLHVHMNEEIQNQLSQGDIAAVDDSVEDRLEALGYR